jgi:hypothetical protein
MFVVSIDGVLIVVRVMAAALLGYDLQWLLDHESFHRCGIWVLIWIAVYLVVLAIGSQFKFKMSRNDELDMLNRVVSIFHGAAALVLSGYHFASYGAHCSLPNVDYENQVFLMSAGYFIYDFLAMGYYGLLDAPMTLHHVVVVIGEIMTVELGSSASLSLAALFIAEISNPAMHTRVILKHLGLRYTKVYELFELTFVFLYTFGRFLLGSYIVYLMVGCSALHITVRISAVVILLQTVFFVTKMVAMVSKRYQEISNRYTKGVNMRWFDPLSDAELKTLGIDRKNEKHFL